MLSNRQDHKARLWFLGAGVYAVVATLFVFKGILPPWVSGPFGNSMSLISIFLMLEALRQEVIKRKPETIFKSYLVVFGLHFFSLNILYANELFDTWGRPLHLTLLSVIELVLIFYANQARKLHQSRSIWILILVFAIFAFSNLIRVFEHWWMGQSTNLLSFTPINNFSLIINYLSVIFYSYGYWGFVVDKHQRALSASIKQTLEARHQQALAEQNENMSKALLQTRTDMMEKLVYVGKQAQSSALSTTIAHELNQPLASIQINIEESLSIIDQNHSSELLKALLQSIKNDNERAADTIRRIRSIFSSGSIQRELIVLDEVVSSTLAILDKTIRTQKVEIDCQLHAPLPFVFGKGEIEHILINLIQNSLDALHLTKKKEGKISITTQHTADNVTLMVSDNGPGIAIERVPKIFHLYESDKINGLGLGLWLAKHIAERNGAVLYYDPQSQDGACFVLTCSKSPNL